MSDWNNAPTPRTERSHPVCSLAVVAVAVILLASGGAVDAKLTTGSCLAQKRTAWSSLRKCQASEQVKQIKGKPIDLAKCQTAFQTKLVKISGKATKAVVG